MYIENFKLKNNICFWLAFNYFLLSIMIIVGGLTRLTDSGLSITQWELFSGILPPLNDIEWNKYFELYKEIPEYNLQNFSMNISEFKVIFWWEWGHRFLGRIIGVSFLLPLIYFYFKIGFKLTKSFLLIFVLICFQGFIGWYMVTSGLVDRVDVSHFRLSIHLVVAFIILSLILWNYLIFSELKKSNHRISQVLPLVFLFLIFVQITIGAFVAGMDAGKIYNTWPLMGTSYFPDDSIYANIFSISAFSDPSLVQFMHRNLAYIILISYLYIFYYIYKNKKHDLYKIINLIGFFLFLQIILGIITLINGAQIITSSMHQISSIFLVSSSIYFIYLNFNQQP
tara:strand:+ start:2243 stop:3262 length:1020 start_codon:yes stop_codon:yes gene_type:complete